MEARVSYIAEENARSRDTFFFKSINTQNLAPKRRALAGLGPSFFAARGFLAAGVLDGLEAADFFLAEGSRLEGAPRRSVLDWFAVRRAKGPHW